MSVNSRVRLALVAVLMLVGLFFLQNHPRSPSVEASKVALPDPKETEHEPAQRQMATSEESAAVAKNIQPVIWTREVELVDQIIRSKNDNDPRLDTDLRVLSEEAKVALRSYYLSRPEEDRNGKGTVLFLLGRNLKGPEDVKFLADALKEAPCRSLANCSSEAVVLDHHESQHDTSPEVTLAYPKVVTLNMFEKELRNPALTREMRAEILASIKASVNSEEPAVSKRAAAIIEKTQRR